MRLLGEDREPLGVFPIEDALAIAQDKGLDLLLIVPDASPPVCRCVRVWVLVWVWVCRGAARGGRTWVGKEAWHACGERAGAAWPGRPAAVSGTLLASSDARPPAPCCPA